MVQGKGEGGGSKSWPQSTYLTRSCVIRRSSLVATASCSCELRVVNSEPAASSEDGNAATGVELGTGEGFVPVRQMDVIRNGYIYKHRTSRNIVDTIFPLML